MPVPRLEFCRLRLNAAPAHAVLTLASVLPGAGMPLQATLDCQPKRMFGRVVALVLVDSVLAQTPDASARYHRL